MNKLKSLAHEIFNMFNLKLFLRTSTLYKWVEEAQFESEVYLQCLIEYITDWTIYLFDSDGYGVNWKHAAEHLNILTREEITVQSVTAFYYKKFIREPKYQLMCKN